jgi:HEPN domain-containing protein
VKNVLRILSVFTLHAQQCVEKYLKAFLVLEGIDFPKTHDIEVLTALLPKRVRPKLADEEQAKLTEYATVARYPGWGPIPLAEARRAVVTACRVCKEMRTVTERDPATKGVSDGILVQGSDAS